MQGDVTEILENLVSFNTVSHRSNLPLLDYVEEFLLDHGFTCERVYDATGEKANMLARIGPEGPNGFILSGHTDVVPVEGQEWSRDPFQLCEEDGKLYGRGSCDMKGFLACCLAKAGAMAQAPLIRPLYLAFSYDEEIGCVGVRGLLDDLAAKNFAAEACFVGEPTNMQVVLAHKSKASYRVHFTGFSCHSSLAPQGVNAVSYAAKLVAKLDEMAAALANGPSDALFDLPYSTAHVGVFQGGTALNIVPDSAEVIFEFRVLPTEDLEACIAEVKDFAFQDLLPQMQSVYPQADITFETYSEIDGLNTSAEAPVSALAKRLAGRNDHAKVAYGTEAGLFQNVLAVPTVVVGPGSIEQAHKPDEFIERAELDKCLSFLDRLISQACQPV
ncbi:acetylornithine deacetylase [Polycladidibacter hongkongensis]|uniref:acetylornithine deacetylase n=1 Tax=Polycladidibacter hongkongensis TaxID=1647556 RepID=UPI000830E617|nr:acetylornithine deacetylase [Pseudovibrio hongkongensis]